MAMKAILVPIPDTAVDPAAIDIALMAAKADGPCRRALH